MLISLQRSESALEFIMHRNQSVNTTSLSYFAHEFVGPSSTILPPRLLMARAGATRDRRPTEEHYRDLSPQSNRYIR
jgi:hypothetical protein